MLWTSFASSTAAHDSIWRFLWCMLLSVTGLSAGDIWLVFFGCRSSAGVRLHILFAFCCYAGIGLAGIVAIRPVADVMISSSCSASRSFALSLGLHALSLVNHAMPNSNLY